MKFFLLIWTLCFLRIKILFGLGLLFFLQYDLFIVVKYT